MLLAISVLLNEPTVNVLSYEVIGDYYHVTVRGKGVTVLDRQRVDRLYYLITAYQQNHD